MLFLGYIMQQKYILFVFQIQTHATKYDAKA